MKNIIFSMLIFFFILITNASAGILESINDDNLKQNDRRDKSIQLVLSIASYAYSRTAFIYEYDEYKAIFKMDYSKIEDMENNIKNTEIQIHKMKQEIKLVNADKTKFNQAINLKRELQSLNLKIVNYNDLLDDAVRNYSKTVQEGIKISSNGMRLGEADLKHFKRAKFFKALGRTLVMASFVLGTDLIFQYLLEARLNESFKDAKNEDKFDAFIKGIESDIEEAHADNEEDVDNEEDPVLVF